MDQFVNSVSTNAWCQAATKPQKSVRSEIEIEEYEHKDKHPDIDQDTTPVRYWLQMMLVHSATECVLTVVILLNLVVLVVETDLQSDDGSTPRWIEITSLTIFFIFVCEVTLKVYTFRGHILMSPWQMLDVAIISTDVFFKVLSLFLTNMPAISMMRILRLLRLARTAKILSIVPQLNIIVLSLAGASTPLFWGCIMLLLLLVTYGILAVQLIQPVVQDIHNEGGFKGCERCPRAFATVGHSALTFTQQIIAGDSWGEVTLPVVERNPWTVLFFGFVFMSLTMAVMNIILANIVDATMQARVSNDHHIALVKQRELRKIKVQFLEFFKHLDVDDDGELTHEEFLAGYASEVRFRKALNAMDIRKEDLITLWHILDVDESGRVSYEEFCDQLFRFKSSDLRTMLMVIKSHTADIRNQVRAVSTAKLAQIMTSLQGAVETLQEHGDLFELLLKKNDMSADQGTKPCNTSEAIERSVVTFEDSAMHDVFPQDPHINSCPDRYHLEQQALNNEHQLSMEGFLESLSRIERRFEAQIGLLSSLVTTTAIAGNPALPRPLGELSSNNEMKPSMYQQAVEDSDGPNDIWAPMCCNAICKAKPAVKSRIINEPSQTIGQTLPAMPNGWVQRVVPDERQEKKC